jgi:RNA polymerase sigma-70 factor (ECF subfamily)
MTKDERDELEAAIRGLCEREDHRGAATRALTGYGNEVYGYLAGMLRDHDEADEGFQMFGLDVTRGMAGFRWECLFRTWAYTVARHAISRFKQRGEDDQPQEVPLAESDPALAQTVQTLLTTWRRTTMRDAFRDLRRELPEEDQTILILRVDREMPWTEVARVTGGFDSAVGRDVLKNEVDRIKKRYERAVEKLRSLGIARGLIEVAEV